MTNPPRNPYFLPAKRRSTASLATALLAAWLLMTPALARADVSEARGSRPNIIFVMVDDMGYGDLGVYGQELIRMPHVDRMAREGIRYTNAYSGSTVCAPARSVLMTGQHTGHTTVRGNAGRPGHGGVPCTGGAGGIRVPLRENDVTVADVLRQAGYVTGITGKWGLGEPGTTGVPNRQGFDEWLGLLNQRRAHSHYPEYIWHNEQKMVLEGNTGTRRDFVNERHYTHDLFTDFALDFIRRHGPGDDPFFLYVPYCVPHDRFQIPELEPYTRDADWPRQAKAYASMLTRTDRDMGRMFALLEELGIDEQTIVFFCSDNGAADRYDGLFDSSGPLRGRKRAMYDGGLRTVMVVRWPGKIDPDAVSDDIWYFADVLPTFAELAGAEPPQAIDGVSVLPSLLSRPQPELRERPLYWEFHERGFQQAARKGNWKAVRPAHDRPLELYNLADDIGERNNIADEHPERVAWFDQYMRQARTPSVNWPSPIDAIADSPARRRKEGFVLVRHVIDTAIEEGDGQSLADVTGDGSNNIIVGTGDGGRVYWYERTSPSSWKRHLIAEGLVEIEGTIAGDFNNDGQIEVIILDQATRAPGKPNVYIAKQDTNDPRQSWSVAVLDDAAPHVQQGIAFDVNENGRLDFVYAYEGRRNGEGGFYWMENKGGDPLDPGNWIKHEIGQMEGAWWIDYNSPKDFNSNGNRGDILVGARAGGRAPPNATGGIFIYLRPDDTTRPWERITVDASFPTLQVSSGDLTGNGDDRDVVAGACHDSRHTGLYIYDSSRDWKKIEVERDHNWWGTYACDINQDGRAEIISGERTGNTLRIYTYDADQRRYTLRASDHFRKPDDQILFDDITGDGHSTEFFVGSDPDGLFWYQAYGAGDGSRGGSSSRNSAVARMEQNFGPHMLQ